MFDFIVVPLSKQIWPKMWLLNFWAATGVPSLLNGTSYLSNTSLAQTRRSSSMASSWLIFFERKKKTQKNWASYVALSWRTNVKAQKRIHNMYWPGWWRHTELAQGHVDGSSFFCFRSKKLSQLRGAEPATRHWASYVALSQQRGNGESVLYGTDGFSDAAFAVQTNHIID